MPWANPADPIPGCRTCGPFKYWGELTPLRHMAGKLIFPKRHEIGRIRTAWSSGDIVTAEMLDGFIKDA